MMELPTAFVYVWFWRARHPERKGQRCRIMEVIGPEVRVEFRDGAQITEVRSAIRRVR